MISLVYRSVASESFDVSQIYHMLSDARDRNVYNDITGCLLFHNNQFLQLLEGEDDKVKTLFEKISNDDRQHEITVICEEQRNGRLFKDWSMAFHDYGQNGTSANIKLKQIDTIFNASGVFMEPNKIAIPFFENVKEILFSKTDH